MEVEVQNAELIYYNITLTLIKGQNVNCLSLLFNHKLCMVDMGQISEKEKTSPNFILVPLF